MYQKELILEQEKLLVQSDEIIAFLKEFLKNKHNFKETMPRFETGKWSLDLPFNELPITDDTEEQTEVPVFWYYFVAMNMLLFCWWICDK